MNIHSTLQRGTSAQLGFSVPSTLDPKLENALNYVRPFWARPSNKTADYDPILQVPLIRKMVRIAGASIDQRKPLPITFNILDAKNLFRVITESIKFDSSGNFIHSKQCSDSSYELSKRLQFYFAAYLVTKDGFVSRNGTNYKPVAIDGSKNQFADQTADSVVTIISEAVYDYLLETPFYYKQSDPKKTVVTKTGLVPTASLFEPEEPKKIEMRRIVDGATAEGKDITLCEWNYLQYLSELAALKSKLLSGTTTRLFGKADLNFGAGLGFSLGDHQMLTSASDAFFETSSRRLTFDLLRKALEENCTSEDGQLFREKFQTMMRRSGLCGLVDKLK